MSKTTIAIIIYLITSLVSQVVFIWLKLLGSINWEWHYVLAPLEIFVLILIGLYISIMFLMSEDTEEDRYM